MALIYFIIKVVHTLIVIEALTPVANRYDIITC